MEQSLNHEKVYNSVISCYINILERNLSEMKNCSSTSNTISNEEYFGFIPYPFTPGILTGFDKAVELLKKGKRIKDSYTPKFLDVGCGIGNIILLAQSYGFIPYGIDNDKVNSKT